MPDPLEIEVVSIDGAPPPTRNQAPPVGDPAPWFRSTAASPLPDRGVVPPPPARRVPAGRLAAVRCRRPGVLAWPSGSCAAFSAHRAPRPRPLRRPFASTLVERAEIHRSGASCPQLVHSVSGALEYTLPEGAGTVSNEDR